MKISTVNSHDAHPDVDRDVALDRVDDHRRGRIAQQEHAGEAHPHHPPGDGVAAPLVRRPAAQRANRPGRQVEQDRQERGGGQRQPVLADVVLGQPERQRHERAEHEVVGEAEAPDAQVEQRQELLGELRMAPRRRVLAVQRVFGRQEPEQHRHHQHRDRIDLGHHAPRRRGGGRDDQRRDELRERGTRVAGAEDAHRRALPLLAEPGRRVGDADGERAAGHPDEESQHQVLPVLGRVGQHPGGDHHREHLQEVHDPPAVAVGQDAERQAHERARQDGGRHQQAELGLVEVQLRLDLDADDREHHPHGEVHREGERAHRQRRDLFAAHARPDCGGCRHVRSPHVVRTARRDIRCSLPGMRLDRRQGALRGVSRLVISNYSRHRPFASRRAAHWGMTGLRAAVHNRRTHNEGEHDEHAANRGRAAGNAHRHGGHRRLASRRRRVLGEPPASASPTAISRSRCPRSCAASPSGGCGESSRSRC